MNWKDIKVTPDNKGFTYQGEKLFDQQFIEVLKFHEPGLAPVKDDAGAYHIKPTGEQLYAERYDRTFGFYCNRASVVQDGNWFHLDIDGQKAYHQTYDWSGNFQENLCAVRLKNDYYHIDLMGNRIYEGNHKYVGDFKDDIACVKLSSGLFRHINTKGDYINDTEFLDLGIFHKGFATAKDDQGWHHINIHGAPLYKQRYALIEPFYNGFALVTDFEGNKVIIDETGKVVHAI